MAKKAVKDLTRISNPANQNKCPNQAFTLVELLVVVALIGLMSLIALPSVSNYFKISLNSVTRELATVIKESYNATTITGRVHRLVYDLDNLEFWVESGPTDILLDTAETREEEERRNRFLSETEKEKEKKKVPAFSLEGTITRKKISLPRGVSFKDIITEQSEEPVTEGLAYTHFFPNGITEQTIINLQDSDQHQISLIVSALIGRSELANGYIKKETTFGKK